MKVELLFEDAPQRSTMMVMVLDRPMWPGTVECAVQRFVVTIIPESLSKVHVNFSTTCYVIMDLSVSASRSRWPMSIVNIRKQI